MESHFDSSQDAPINFYEGGLIIAMIIAALTVLFSKTRMVSLNRCRCPWLSCFHVLCYFPGTRFSTNTIRC